MAGKELQTSQSAHKEVLVLKTIMREMPTDMRLFSLAIRSLYAEKAVGGNSKASRQFRELRDATRNDAMVYLKVLLPLSTDYVSCISEYFEYYDALEFEEWCEMLPDILQETVAFKQLAEALVKMHEDILVPLKKRQDQANIVVHKMQYLQQELEKKKEELEKKASSKRGWAIGLAFIPFINVIASPVLAAAADKDLAEAVAQGAESNIQETAAVAISETLIPALQHFIDGLLKAAGFFSIVENELKKLTNKTGRILESPKKLHYKTMKREAEDMKSICQAFYAILPAVRTDFEAIPTKGTDQNYVDMWLVQQREVIQKKMARKELQTSQSAHKEMARKELQTSQSAHKEVLVLKTIMREMPTDMRLFSLAMRSLYAEKAVGGNSQASQHFRELRDATRNDAMVYLKVLLPLSTDYVSCISEYFEYYDALEFEEWCEMLPDILQETVAFKKLAVALVKMHEDILIPLKKRQDQANIVVHEMQDLQQELEKKKEELEEKASSKRGWAIGLAFIPFINVIASPVLAAAADKDLAEAVAQGAESKIQETAAVAISETLIPALQHFIGGLLKAAGFFSIVENELKKLTNKTGRSLESPKKLHYKTMKREAEDMKSICQAFYAILPAVRTDFEAIPTKGIDQNYVDKWLQQQRKILETETMRTDFEAIPSERTGQNYGVSVRDIARRFALF